MGKRRLRKEVEEAIKERDVILAQADEAIKRVDRAVRPFIEEYGEVNGVLRGDNEEGGNGE